MALNVRCLFAGLLVASIAVSASAQSPGAAGKPQTPLAPVAKVEKPLTPERIAWLKARCSQLVAYFDRYGSSRAENSDGPRNHTRIAAAIQCEKGDYRGGIDKMAALLARKRFDLPKPGTPVVEPEDLEVP